MARKCVKQDNPVESEKNVCLRDCYNTVKNDPAFRGILLKKADELYEAGEHLASIECQIEALCLGFRAKFFSSDYCSFDFDFHMKFLKNLEILHADDECAGDFEPVLGWDYIKSELKKFNEKDKSGKEDGIVHEDTKALVQKCQELPQEWTILHLCKNFDSNSTSSLQRELLCNNVGIFLTLLKYPRAEINNHEPLCVLLPPFEAENIYLMVHEIAQTQMNSMKFTENVDRVAYWDNLKELDQRYLKLIDLIIKWMGPWVVFFHGREKDEENAREKKIFAIVDDFVEKQKFSTRQRILLSLICSSLDLLTDNDDDVDRAAREISRSPKEYKLIKDFLSVEENFPQVEKNIPRYPIFLIVDELLDQFPWELILPENETTRISSLHILLRLYDKYKSKIKKGYLQLNVKVGNALINPDGDLVKMEKRITTFLKYWLPDWKQIVQKTPSSEEMRNLLESTDIFLYSGHGSALKFIKPGDLVKDNLACIVMLFGCESVRLKSNGFCSEMCGAHLYYHCVLCPLVIGATNVITDLPTDQLCSRILSTWFKSKAPKHFALADNKSFQHGIIEFKKNAQPLWEKRHNPSILGIFADVRQTESITVWLRASMILRGLPIWLTEN